MTSFPITPPAGAALDIVFIDGFVGQTVIGIHHDELHDSQAVRLDLAIGMPRSRACDTDRIGDTIDYSKVCEALRAHYANHRVRLLEAFAEGISDMLLRDFRASWVRIRATKPHKFHDVEGAGVLIERWRNDPS